MDEQETLEEAVKKYSEKEYSTPKPLAICIDFASFGAKWQQERSFSLEQISKDFIGENKQSGYIDDYFDFQLNLNGENPKQIKLTFKEWFEKFKKK